MEGKQAQMLDKVRKLLAKAESTTPEEAEAITSKAQELMTEYAITESMIAHAQGRQLGDKVTRRDINLGKSVYMNTYVSLMSTIARNNNCKIVQSYGWQKSECTVWVIGFESDIDNVEVLYTSLLLQMTRAMKAFSKTLSPYLSGHEKAISRRDFCFGFGYGVGDQLREANKRARQNVVEEQVDLDLTEDEQQVARETATSGMQLVLASKTQQVSSWYDEHIAKFVSKGRSSGISLGRDASSQGRSAGRTADIGNRRLGRNRELGR